MIGLDVNSAMLAEAEHTGLPVYSGGCVVHDANKGLCQFHDKQFDAVVCVGTSVYLDPKIVFPEMIWVIKKGFRVLVITNTSNVNLKKLIRTPRLKSSRILQTISRR
jgi:ubiquinone/menaquinone biosynthesis C-methylase UbiE